MKKFMITYRNYDEIIDFTTSPPVPRKVLKAV